MTGNLALEAETAVSRLPVLTANTIAKSQQNVQKHYTHHTNHIPNTTHIQYSEINKNKTQEQFSQNYKP